MKNCIKQSIVYILVVALLFNYFAIVPVNAEETVYTTVDGYSYTVDASGNATITDYTGEATTLNIPSIIDGHPVTAIGNEAFDKSQSLVNVVVPDSVLSFGEHAFYQCKNLESIVLSSNITHIPYGLFYMCSKLSSINIPNGVTSIGKSAFGLCEALTSVNIPNSVTDIGISAFGSCASLASVVIPDSVTSIGRTAFYGCRALTEIQISKNITFIDKWTFEGCISLAELTIPSNVTAIGSEVFKSCSSEMVVCYPSGLLGKEEVTGIGVAYTLNADGTASVKVEKTPSDVKKIPIPGTIMGNMVNKIDAVDGIDMSKIELIVPFTITTQPANINSIYGNADGQKLTVGVTKTNGNETIDFQWYEGDNPIEGALSDVYVIPSNKPIGTYTYYCEVLSGDYHVKTEFATVKVVPKAITVQIDSCSKIVGDDNPVFTYTVPTGALVASDTVDDWEVSLTTTATKDSPAGEYPITGTIKSGKYEITVMPGVLTVVASKEEMDDESPEEEPNYIDPEEQEPRKGDVFKDKNNKAVYKVTKTGTAKGVVGTVEYQKPVKNMIKTVVIPSTVTVGGIKYKVTSIAKYAFKNNNIVTKITIGKYVKSIGVSAFYKCKKLKTVIMGNNVVTIGDKAFCKCVALAKITLPSKVSKIGKQTFYGCKKLKSIIVKTKKLTAKKMGKQAFKGIYAKATIKVPKSKYKSYKTLFKKAGVGKKIKYKKN